MKSILTIAMLTLSAGYTLAAFAGLIGILPSSVFLGSEVAFTFYSLVGLAAIGFGDNGRRSSREHAV